MESLLTKLEPIVAIGGRRRMREKKRLFAGNLLFSVLVSFSSDSHSGVPEKFSELRRIRLQGRGYPGASDCRCVVQRSFRVDPSLFDRGSTLSAIPRGPSRRSLSRTSPTSQEEDCRRCPTPCQSSTCPASYPKLLRGSSLGPPPSRA